MTQDIKFAVVGAGLIGKSHASRILAQPGAALACIVDPDPAGRQFAQSLDVSWRCAIEDMFDKDDIDGVILATPSRLHAEGALACIANRCPVLVEKPLAISTEAAARIVAAADAADVAVLTGHHRRHGGIVKQARKILDRGVLGTVVSFQGTCWFHKPAEYFDVAWRVGPGGGPVHINMIHDINTLLHLFGEVDTVHALVSNRVRGGDVEDTAAILLGFASGVLGTITVSDTAVAPWSWEMTARENPDFPATSESCCLIGGTHAALSLPDLSIWRHQGERSWLNPLGKDRVHVAQEDPLAAQIRQFMAVIRGDAAPLVPAEEGLRTLRVVEAVMRSAASGQTMRLGSREGHRP
jgi:predicted dehydrogenase